MGGKVKSNDVEIQKQLTALKYELKAVTLNYSIPMMKAACYFKQMRGFANSGAVEVCYLCWKGAFPKNCAKSRAHVDAGSPTYCDFMSKVPIATMCSQRRWTGPVLAAPMDRTSARSTDGQDQCSQHRRRRAAAAPLRGASGVAACRLGKERLPAPPRR